MIRHCVLVRFRPDVDQTARETVYDGLRALVGGLDGLLAGSFGANVSPEGLDRGYNGGFTMDFRDAAARDAYLADPAHKAAGAALVATLAGGRDGLVVFDLEI